jgi:hypothetical protein
MLSRDGIGWFTKLPPYPRHSHGHTRAMV